MHQRRRSADRDDGQDDDQRQAVASLNLPTQQELYGIRAARAPSVQEPRKGRRRGAGRIW